MENTLIKQIEDQLEVFARDPSLLLCVSDKIDHIDEEWERAGESGRVVLEMDINEFRVLKVGMDFTVGCLANYLPEEVE